MKSRQLLCTFSNILSYKTDIKHISELYCNAVAKYFVFQNKKVLRDVYITYNVEITDNIDKFPCTISIHRKKETNSLYTLNAMNNLIREENGGVFDKKFILDWELYKNCMILTGDISVRIIEIKLIDVL